MERIKTISHTSQRIALETSAHWDSVAKPLHSLGLLESAITKIASVQKTSDPHIDKRTVVVMCADNGVVKENISQSDSSVTAICAEAIAEGRSNINQLADTFGADVLAVDMGMCSDVNNKFIIKKRTGNGTKNIAEGPAMTLQQAKEAIKAGIDIAEQLKNDGTEIIVTGEMGIGNTTTSAALSSVILSLPPEKVTGRGAGLSSDGLRRKISVIKKAIEINKDYLNEPVSMLASLGGYDIAGMTGLFLGGAIYRIPVVIDGVISAVSAAIAAQISPFCIEYMLASHVSLEPAGTLLLQKLGLKPIITAELHLGEGTGGVMLLPLLDGALAVYRNAHRFDDTTIERYVELK